MGPRLISRGKLALRLGDILLQFASMGPRLISRGKCNRGGGGFDFCLASMGPRLISRGKHCMAHLSWVYRRSFNGAAADQPRKVDNQSTQRAHQRRFNGAAADQPRKGYIVRLSVRAAVTASMGPRLISRGKVFRLR